MYKYKFTCINKEDFLFKAKIANVDIKYYSKAIDGWFKGTSPLIGEDNVWIVDEDGYLSCYGKRFANENLSHVKEIVRDEINVGGL